MVIKALKPRLAEAGKIKIGGLSDKAQKARGSGREWYAPVKYDEFHVTTLERAATGNKTLVDDGPLMWHLRYFNASADLKAKADAALNAKAKAELVRGVKIRKIPVYLHADDMDEVLRTEYAAYVGKVRYKECDGETCTLFKIRQGSDGMVATGEQVRKPCECPKGPSGYVSKRNWDKKTPAQERFICKPKGEFRCLINLPGASGPGALYSFRTTGWDSLGSLFGALTDIQKRCGGFLANIPCLLVMHRGKGRDQNNRETTFWAVHLEMDVDLISALGTLRQLSAMRTSLEGSPAPRAIPGTAGAGTPAEETDVAEEFYPEEDEIQDADFEERGPEAVEEPPFEDVPPPEGDASCAECGTVTPEVLRANDDRLRCIPCHKEWTEGQTGPTTTVREPGDDNEDAKGSAAEPAPAAAPEKAPDATEESKDERTDPQLRHAVTHRWRDYAAQTEHPDGDGALYRAMCEAAGFGDAVQLEDAPRADLHKLETFLIQGIAALKKHEPVGPDAFEDDIPFE